jgi:tetratricopeptide (TPR) repeat protein
MPQSNELRVFISSTFRDLQEEREHLVKKVFPEIRALCRERGITFTEVDLRWGLTEEEGTLGRIIRTCLEEIDRCRPYFIGITGDRYGYVPEIVEIYKDPELLRQYPWIEEAASNGWSIIEMEFHHAALRDPEDARVVRFFFRRHRSHFPPHVGGDRWSREEGSEDAARLELLKSHVRESHLPVEEFRDPVSLGEVIYDELIEIITQKFSDARPPTPLEEEQVRHAAFAASRRHAYIPNPDYLSRLTKFVSSDETALVVYAESGSGKSALLAYWAEQFRQKHPEAFLIEHYVGIGAGRTDHLEIMRHVMIEIKDRFGLQKELPNTSEAIERAFPVWLAEVQKEEMVLIIDGLNQLQGAALSLAWLPKHIPAKIRLIVSSTVEQTLVAIRERGWQQMGMQPLARNEREAVIVRFFSEYHKALPASMVEKIADDVKCAQPLFLRTLLEELRLYGHHEKIEREIDGLLATTGPEDLFQKVLERLEDDFSTKAVRQVMSLIWGSREGLSEIELAEITGISRMKLSSLLIALDYHLLKSSGHYTFFHDYLRRAVEKRYIPDENRKRQVHLEIATYLGNQPLDDRVAMELPWQLREAGEIERLRQAISQMEIVEQLVSKRREPYELLGYWLLCGGVAAMEESYSRQLESGVDGTSVDERKMNMVLSACKLYQVSGIAPQALPPARRAMVACEASLGSDHPLTLKSISMLANLLMDIGNYAEAEPLFRRALAIREAYLGEEHPDTALSLYSLATVLGNMGDFKEAEELQRRALAIRQASLGERHTITADSLNNLAILLADIRNYSESEELYRRALTIYEASLGAEHPLTAQTMSNLAALLDTMEDLTEAEQLGRRALAITESSLGAGHPAVANSLNNLANLLVKIGNYTEAEQLHRRTLAIWEATYGTESHHVANSLNNLANLLRSTGRSMESQQLHQRALAIREKTLGTEHPDVAQSLKNLALGFIDAGNTEEAEPLMRRALAIDEIVFGAEHPGVINSLINLAELLTTTGSYSEAESLCRRAVAIAEATFGPDHLQVAYCLHGLAELYLKQHRLTETATCADRALTIRTRELGAENPRTAYTLFLLGKLRRAEGKPEEARELIERVLRIYESVRGVDHPFTKEVQRELEAIENEGGSSEHR